MHRSVAGLALATLTASGCTGATGPAIPTVAGTWALQTINGAHLPYVVSQTSSTTLERVSDVLDIKGANTFTETSVTRTTANGQATVQTSAKAGSYTLSQGTLFEFRFTGDDSTGHGSLSGNTLTIMNGSLAFVYQRQ